MATRVTVYLKIDHLPTHSALQHGIDVGGEFENETAPNRALGLSESNLRNNCFPTYVSACNYIFSQVK